ncbi:MAG: Gx transporter family protein [Candidatus Izemoplasmatales bacterium]|jgi:heptaprenyl diphosphate synthase|nr:Gx transporter family protein [Candidatus Izemoplasmatales bacterium]MDY0373077.1 Gx transporter family protein [Candidatus Izemoplasmatales bacterium]
MKLKKLVFLAILVSASIVLSIVESVISTALFIIPGVKIGLANIVTLVLLYIYGERDAFFVLILRIFIVGLIYSGLMQPTFFMSLSGGIFAFLTMILIKKIKIFSLLSVSVAGSLMHMVGQILMAMIVLKTNAIIYYLPYMILMSIPTGIITGIIAKKMVRIFETQLLKRMD